MALMLTLYLVLIVCSVCMDHIMSDYATLFLIILSNSNRDNKGQNK